MQVQPISHEYLIANFRLDEESGKLFWRNPKRGRSINRPAGHLNKNGYRYITVLGYPRLAHRLVWFYVNGRWPPHHIDHEDHNTDGRKLRPATNSENMQNQIRPRSDSETGFLGVGKHKKKWRARIKLNGKTKFLGLFNSPELAHEAYLKAKRELHHACTI